MPRVQAAIPAKRRCEGGVRRRARQTSTAANSAKVGRRKWEKIYGIPVRNCLVKACLEVTWGKRKEMLRKAVTKPEPTDR
jgi:hypothetical protein